MRDRESPWRLAPAELKEELDLKRGGRPFLAFQRGSAVAFLVLAPDVAAVSIGRGEDCDVRLEDDPWVSGLHAELQRVGSEWLLVDDGHSRNGTYVNDDRVVRRRLRDGDSVRCGRTLLRFHAGDARKAETRFDDVPPAPDLSPGQRRVLVALCRPCATSRGLATPASNRAIADELFLSLDTVKTHVRNLFERFEIGDLPQHHKRARLVELAMASRAVTIDELASD